MNRVILLTLTGSITGGFIYSNFRNTFVTYKESCKFVFSDYFYNYGFIMGGMCGFAYSNLHRSILPMITNSD
jgi:hypothetical protein